MASDAGALEAEGSWRGFINAASHPRPRGRCPRSLPAAAVAHSHHSGGRHTLLIIKVCWVSLHVAVGAGTRARSIHSRQAPALISRSCAPVDFG